MDRVGAAVACATRTLVRSTSSSAQKIGSQRLRPCAAPILRRRPSIAAVAPRPRAGGHHTAAGVRACSSLAARYPHTCSASVAGYDRTLVGGACAPWRAIGGARGVRSGQQRPRVHRRAVPSGDAVKTARARRRHVRAMRRSNVLDGESESEGHALGDGDELVQEQEQTTVELASGTLVPLPR